MCTGAVYFKIVVCIERNPFNQQIPKTPQLCSCALLIDWRGALLIDWRGFTQLHYILHMSCPLRSMMGCRQGARMVECKGIFPAAEVVRGHDWSWGQQDGQCSM